MGPISVAWRPTDYQTKNHVYKRMHNLLTPIVYSIRVIYHVHNIFASMGLRFNLLGWYKAIYPRHTDRSPLAGATRESRGVTPPSRRIQVPKNRQDIQTIPTHQFLLHSDIGKVTNTVALFQDIGAEPYYASDMFGRIVTADVGRL